jgi:hypothetical protein
MQRALHNRQNTISPSLPYQQCGTLSPLSDSRPSWLPDPTSC